MSKSDGEERSKEERPCQALKDEKRGTQRSNGSEGLEGVTGKG